MCALYKKREDVPSNIAHQLTEALIQGTDSILGNCRLFGIYPFLQQIVMILSTLIQRDSLSIANRAG